MSQIFQYKYLTDIDLEDPFFDSLRKDYDGFNVWYKRKESEKRKAFVLYGDQGLLAFIFLKVKLMSVVKIYNLLLSLVEDSK